MQNAIGGDIPTNPFRGRANARLPPEVNRIIFVRNLPFKITTEELYDLFGRYGAIRQIRKGNTKDTRGTAFVVYEDIYDAKNACDSLSGFHVMDRYLIVLYFQPHKQAKKAQLEKQQQEVDRMKAKFNVSGKDADSKK
uniref:RRM domain-containing protein n=1 Tax=Hemiselmis andersenii TaxID=464988 RepID=A0A6T8KS63_HEMAN|mmetsp:Transcript_29354/g.68562  ORF Transcript_29354/g.68562 Transcript_29354/m.68562 type:complete len:138 (+) Transcript_29354:95-508(+)